MIDEWLPSIGLPQLAPKLREARIRPIDLVSLDDSLIRRPVAAGGLGISNELVRRSILSAVRFLA